MLKIKTFKQILGSLISGTVTQNDSLTDFTPGSALRTLYNAIALNIEEFYYAMYDNIKYMIENSLYLAFGFQYLPETYAQGHIEITFYDTLSQDYYLPKDSEFKSDKASYKDLVFVAKDNTIIPRGSISYILPVISKFSGSKHNAPENVINTKVIRDPRIKSISNPKALSGGADRETYDQRVLRFRRFINTLTKATKGALEYAAYSVPGITGVFLEDTRAGLVKLYCHDMNGELTEEMKAKVQEKVEETRAAGVEVLVVNVDKKSIVIKVNIKVYKGKDLVSYQNLVKLYIDNWIRNLPVGYTLSRAELYQTIMNSYDDAIENCLILEPSADVKGSKSSVIVPISIEVGELNA